MDSQTIGTKSQPQKLHGICIQLQGHSCNDRYFLFDHEATDILCPCYWQKGSQGINIAVTYSTHQCVHQYVHSQKP